MRIDRSNFKHEEGYQFYKTLEQAEPYGTEFNQIFNNFLFLGSSSFLQAHNQFTTGSIDHELEGKVIERQKKAKNWKKYAEAMGILSWYLTHNHSDFLGPILEHTEMQNKYVGQFFTPPTLNSVITSLLMQEHTPNDNNRLRISEPCCGSGGMVISMVSKLKGQGFGPRHYFVQAQDLDLRCVRMTYIQLSLLAVPAVVIHGDTLKNESITEYPTIMYCMFPDIKEQPKIETGRKILPHIRVRTRKQKK